MTTLRAHATLVAGALWAALAVAGCHGKDGKHAAPHKPLVARRASPPKQPLAALAARVPPRTGSCAQVKSVKDKREARRVADAVEKALSVPVDVVKADLGARGVWWRVCVGDEDSEARLVALATKWTAPGGPLDRWLDPQPGGAPRFFVLSHDDADRRRGTPAQARALFSFRLKSGAPAVFFGGPAQSALAIASTALTESGATDVVAIGPKGKRALFDDAPAPGCAACEVALKESAVTARRVMGAGDVDPAPGEELLVEERTEGGVRLLSVAELANGALHRTASLVLQSVGRPGYASTGTASVVQADLDRHKEIALATTELLTDGDAACSVAQHVAIYDLRKGKGLVRIDPLKLPAEPADAVVNVITVLDAYGDHAAASRACAAQLAHDPQAGTAQLCLQRVRRLIDADALVDAVNAAGLLAETSEALRPVVAGPFHDAAVALDKDPRLFAGEVDCKTSPLVDKLSSRPLDASAKLARDKARDRLLLSDIDDAVFVTGARDFGADTPLGVITARWLERAKVALPARYAAVEALLLPPAPPPPPPPPPDAGPADAGPADAGPADPADGGGGAGLVAGDGAARDGAAGDGGP